MSAQGLGNKDLKRRKRTLGELVLGESVDRVLGISPGRPLEAWILGARRLVVVGVGGFDGSPEGSVPRRAWLLLGGCLRSRRCLSSCTLKQNEPWPNGHRRRHRTGRAPLQMALGQLQR